jgi:hypothetical protein
MGKIIGGGEESLTKKNMKERSLIGAGAVTGGARSRRCQTRSFKDEDS